MNRVAFLIDGFNLYHSIRAAIADKHITAGKWLNIRSLCESYMSVFGSDATFECCIYFSAYAHHASDPGAVGRHRVLVKALESTGVRVILGRFKRKKVKCRATCGLEGWGHEEKETDVNIAVSLIELFMNDLCDTAVLVSGDTDLVSAVTAAKRLFPAKKVGVGFPYKRFHNELKAVCDYHFQIVADRYQKHVFPDPILLPDRTRLSKPALW